MVRPPLAGAYSGGGGQRGHVSLSPDFEGQFPPPTAPIFPLPNLISEYAPVPLPPLLC